MAFTESKEIGTSARSNVMEQFKDNGLVHSRKVDVHRCILPGLRWVDHLLEGVARLLLVDHHVWIVHVSEVMEGIFCELLSASNVLSIIQVNEVIAWMLVENTFQSVCCFLEELLPLGFEELETFRSDSASVLLLQVSCSGDTLMELCISYFSCDNDFDRASWFHILNFNSKLVQLIHSILIRINSVFTSRLLNSIRLLQKWLRMAKRDKNYVNPYSNRNTYLRSDWKKAFRRKRGGAVVACWAHNPEVGGSKPLSAILFYLLPIQLFAHHFLLISGRDHLLTRYM